ncbi:MAG: sugar transferase [Bacteroidales bacterium]|nr:sugar transferase [Bacteroidales bacterium]
MRHFCYNFLKRLFDLMAAMVALVVTSPLWLVIAIGIKLSSSGPVFYRAERVGRGRKAFTLYKFRSMHVYQPEEGSNRKSEGGFIANEARIFPFGQLLRKSKLDELPQLLNILRGQMSVVGPRPITVAGVEKHYVGPYAKVTDVRPGLACLDSLFDYAHGELFVKDEEEFARTVVPVRDCLAALYVERCNVGVDLYCIGRTLRLMVEIALLHRREFCYTKYEEEARKRVACQAESTESQTAKEYAEQF